MYEEGIQPPAGAGMREEISDIADERHGYLEDGPPLDWVRHVDFMLGADGFVVATRSAIPDVEGESRYKALV